MPSLCLLHRYGDRLFSQFGGGGSILKTKTKGDISVGIGYRATEQEQVKIYPNPSSGKVAITMAEPVTRAHLSIFTLCGKEVLNMTFSGASVNADISALPNGIYIVKLTSEKLVKVGKLIKKL